MAESSIPRLVAANQRDIAEEWARLAAEYSGGQAVSRAELEAQCQTVLQALRDGLAHGMTTDVSAPAFERIREVLGHASQTRAMQGSTPPQTAAFIFSLRQPLFAAIRKAHSDDPRALADDTWLASELVDRLGIHTMEAFQKSREDVILRQQREISELSTPVVKLWHGILALPLIGTLDSDRTQVVMENLLQGIVNHEAQIAIIDITGVPTVDTLVAQHLLKTVAAARLMGADCIISGIRPQIAQTMVHLGVELNVISKASLADAFALALTRVGRAVIVARDKREEPAASEPRAGV